jgi:adenylosuccinate synthase
VDRAQIVIGTNWGDEGKGSVTAKLAQRDPSSLVVLCNGGPQRGHTVTGPDGLRHVFHHLGSATLGGTPTLFSRDFMVNPIFFQEEVKDLKAHGVRIPKVYASNPMVTFPQDMIYNQVTERSNKHGSCGMGIWATECRHAKKPYRLVDVAFLDLRQFSKEWKRVSAYYLERTSDVEERFRDEYIALLRDVGIMEHYWYDLQDMMEAVDISTDEQVFSRYSTVIFEMGQGLELDEDRVDNHPHISGSRTGSKNAIAVLGGSRDVEAFYVTRTYLTRHGNGPLDLETPREGISDRISDLTNEPNEWQGSIRYAPLDPVRMIGGIRNDLSPGVRQNLVITHVDETDSMMFIQMGGVRKFVDIQLMTTYGFRSALDGGVFVSGSDSSLDPLRSFSW